jgi:cytochrome c-type biogenesis protein CcmH/NrfG
MSERSNRKPWRQILVIAISAAFLGTMIIPIVQSFTDSSSQISNNVDPSNEQALQKQLQEQAKNYEAVLQREPDNQLALQGLAEARLLMNDAKGAIAPLEKLIELNPNNPVALEGLAKAKIRMGDNQGAIAPLEKLAKLYPEQQEIKSVLEQLKQQVAQESQQPKTESKK